MPSIEIVCVGQTEVSKFENLPFRLKAENRLVSDRSPRPLFKEGFDALQGCIYHLLDPERGPTAYLLLDTSLEFMERVKSPYRGCLISHIRFLPEYAPMVHAILKTLLEASPIGEVLFTSDYQFGPDGQLYLRPLTLEKFWALHDADKLNMNALYPLRRGR